MQWEFPIQKPLTVFFRISYAVAAWDVCSNYDRIPQTTHAIPCVCAEELLLNRFRLVLRERPVHVGKNECDFCFSSSLVHDRVLGRIEMKCLNVERLGARIEDDWPHSYYRLHSDANVDYSINVNSLFVSEWRTNGISAQARQVHANRDQLTCCVWRRNWHQFHTVKFPINWFLVWFAFIYCLVFIQRSKASNQTVHMNDSELCGAATNSITTQRMCVAIRVNGK